MTREFREIATAEQRLELLDCLFAVAAADGSISSVEESQAGQIAKELGFMQRSTPRRSRPTRSIGRCCGRCGRRGEAHDNAQDADHPGGGRPGGENLEGGVWICASRYNGSLLRGFS